jgi:hypothetical protein
MGCDLTLGSNDYRIGLHGAIAKSEKTIAAWNKRTPKPVEAV